MRSVKLVHVSDALGGLTELTLANGVGRGSSRLDYYSDATKHASNNHTDLATPSIARRADKREYDNTSYLIHGGDNTSPCTSTSDAVVVLEVLVGKKRAEHGAVESVAGGAKEAHKPANVYEHRRAGEELDRLFQLGLCDGL